MTPEEAKRLGLEQVGWWIAPWGVEGERLSFYDPGFQHERERVYRVADPAALVEALAERDALRADNQRLTWAVESCVAVIENHLDVGNEDAMVDLLHDLRAHAVIAAAALSATQETPDG